MFYKVQNKVKESSKKETFKITKYRYDIKGINKTMEIFENKT